VKNPRTTSIAVAGLGNMGLPMARHLLKAGYRVVGVDSRQAPLSGLAAAGGEPGDIASAAATGLVVLMLPNSAVVNEVVEGSDGVAGLADLMRPGGLVIDMSSSHPAETLRLHGLLARRGIALVDAPVSGGVVGAVNGTLSIMVGGDSQAVTRAWPVLDHVGSTIVATGGPGSGHTVKALNNLLSAASLLATSEAVSVARSFGIDTRLLIEVLNTSSGRSFSTEVKFPRYVLPETFNSGFTLGLMSKDVSTAVSLADGLGIAAPFAHLCADLWAGAAANLSDTADHTEIALWSAPSEDAR
jgi:3-hydroxyisobutyrate dehydrogenase